MEWGEARPLFPLLFSHSLHPPQCQLSESPSCSSQRGCSFFSIPHRQGHKDYDRCQRLVIKACSFTQQTWWTVFVIRAAREAETGGKFRDSQGNLSSLCLKMKQWKEEEPRDVTHWERVHPRHEQDPGWVQSPAPTNTQKETNVMKWPLHPWHSARLWDTETNKAQRLLRGYGLEWSYHELITVWDTLQAQDSGIMSIGIMRKLRVYWWGG